MLGFLNPWLYSVAGKEGFTDVMGGTATSCGTEGFPVSSGWDVVSGFGTPRFRDLLRLVGVGRTSLGDTHPVVVQGGNQTVAPVVNAGGQAVNPRPVVVSGGDGWPEATQVPAGGWPMVPGDWPGHEAPPVQGVGGGWPSMSRPNSGGWTAP